MKPLRISIAARGLTEGFSGVNEFVQGMAGAFLEYQPEWEIYLYYNSSQALGRFPKARERVLKSRSRLLWDYILLPLAMRRDQIDVAIFPKGPIPWFAPRQSIAMILDLGYFYPDLRAYKLFDTWYMRLALPLAARRAWKVFTISEYTRQDVLRLFKVPPDKVLTTYLATSAGYRRVTDDKKLEEVRQRYRLVQPFVFYPTSFSPRKNVERLLEAFRSVSDQIPHHLYLTGRQTWRKNEIMERLTGTLSERVHLLGSVPAEDMPSIYTLADFTVYVSLFEGFGLPVVEAFRCGSPAIISDLTSLPEVAGDAALIVGGYNIESIRQGLLRLAQDESLRWELVARGYQRAEYFTWERTVRKISEVIGKEK
ncbi:MAG: glycosyltransferase family 4 protein [Chloroflexota bacterium]